MRVLLTNDDGIFAPGMKALVDGLSSIHEVYVIAPDRERSGVGHGFTLGHGITCVEENQVFADTDVAQAWKCSGTPVDCVKIGLLVFLKDMRPDLIISGINKGANLSLDHLYSGTVAAALEGTLASIPAVSISVCDEPTGVFHYDSAALVLRRLLSESEFTQMLSGEYSLNVNVPALSVDKINGYRLTSIGKSYYKDCYVPHKSEDGTVEYFLQGTPCITDASANADNVAVRDGYVSITPFGRDLTSYETLKSFGKKTIFSS